MKCYDFDNAFRCHQRINNIFSLPDQYEIGINLPNLQMICMLYMVMVQLEHRTHNRRVTGLRFLALQSWHVTGSLNRKWEPGRMCWLYVWVMPCYNYGSRYSMLPWELRCVPESESGIVKAIFVKHLSKVPYLICMAPYKYFNYKLSIYLTWKVGFLVLYNLYNRFCYCFQLFVMSTCLMRSIYSWFYIISIMSFVVGCCFQLFVMSTYVMRKDGQLWCLLLEMDTLILLSYSLIIGNLFYSNATI